MNIEDESESGRVGESSVHVKEEVVEDEGGEGTFASVDGDWEKGGVGCGLVSAGGNEKKDASVSDDGSSSSPSSSSSSGTSSSSKEVEEDVGNSLCENINSSFIVQQSSLEKHVPDSRIGEGGGAVVLKTEVVDGFLRKMNIEDESESGRVGESAVHVKEEVVEEEGGGGTFTSVDGDWEKGGVGCGLVSAGGNEKKDASVSDDGSSSSPSSSSSSGTSSSSKEEEEDADAENDDVEEEETGPASPSASASSSSLEDDDLDNAEVEEGEIRDLRPKKRGEMFADSDIDEEEEVIKGPIKSKNELDPENLPPVPLIDVTLEPQHSTLPVGVVLSMMENKVVVEGSEKHNPLTEGSILWITEKRLPLGLVDEIFGPVKNPYYVVRYNSDKEVPPGVQEGTAISFVREFADYVLNNKDIYKKGYDASGENDEEIVDETEFSDDEKEAEYKKSQQQKTKRPTNGRKVKLETMERKKVQNRGGFSNRNRSSDSGVKSLPVVPPLIPRHRQMHPSSGQFSNCIPLHSQSQPPLPSIAPPLHSQSQPTLPSIAPPLPSMSPVVCPPRVVNQQMPSVSLSAVCSPPIPNIHQIPNLPPNHFGIVGSFIPLPAPLGTCGTVANTFHAHGLPVPSAHVVQQPVSSLGNFQQQLPSAWATLPSCQQQQQQQPVFSGVQWRCEPAGQQLPGLLGNPLQGVQKFDSPGAFPQQSVSQVPGCVNWQEFMNQSNLNGVAFHGGMHGNPTANAVQQWDGMVGFNAEQTGQFNTNQRFGQFVPGTANNFTPKRGGPVNAPDNRRQSPKGGNFHKRKGHWQRSRQ
ncbi:unnamed protein product [Victoria cruziana]